MGAKNRSVLLAKLVGDGLLVLTCFLHGKGDGSLKAVQLLFEAIAFDETLRNEIVLGIQQKSGTNRDAGRDRYAAFDFH